MFICLWCSNWIIHRDLKPSNILVRTEPHTHKMKFNFILNILWLLSFLLGNGGWRRAWPSQNCWFWSCKDISSSSQTSLWEWGSPLLPFSFLFYSFLFVIFACANFKFQIKTLCYLWMINNWYVRLWWQFGIVLRSYCLVQNTIRVLSVCPL